MPKYGRGLNREIVGAVNKGIIFEPFRTSDIRQFTASKGWSVPETYINVTLANASSDEHSETYKKFFIRIDDGIYKVKPNYRGSHWE
jgi:hypothetical protein